MSYLEDYIELNETASKARELSDQLNTKINGCLGKLKEFLNDDEQEPAIVDRYK